MIKRSQVPLADKWDTEVLYKNIDDWKKNYQHWKGEKSSPRWPELTNLRGKLSQDPKIILKLIKFYFELDQALSKLYVYAHLRHDEDVTEPQFQEALSQIQWLYQEFNQESCWIEPEILSLPEAFLKQLIGLPDFKEYQFYLERLVWQKPHILEEDKEKILASASLALSNSKKAFQAFNNADLRFPSVQDKDGNSHPLTHGLYIQYLHHTDRELRKNSFQTLLNTYGSWENMLCELIQGKAFQAYFLAKTRKFSSCLEAALFCNRIDQEVYTNLISTVRKNLASLHKYMYLRKEILKVEELHLYDMHVSLVPEIDIKIDFETAKDLIIESVAPLGEKYQSSLKRGLNEDRWVDRYENEKKRSGAYSSGCYGTLPYILMNYHGSFSDMMTLAHEAGHSMHSLLTWNRQPYHYSSYPIFVAEIASTFNEELLFHHLLKVWEDRPKMAYIINQKIQEIFQTFFRQTMFAEFELKVHQLIEQGVPLTAKFVKQIYHELVVDYFGPAVTIDSEIDIEWGRIPHFYGDFYVYQYATGISAAHALFNLVLEKGPSSYLEFLSAGGSHFPLDLLNIAGINMKEPFAVEALIHHFNDLVENLRTVLNVNVQV